MGIPYPRRSRRVYCDVWLPPEGFFSSHTQSRTQRGALVRVVSYSGPQDARRIQKLDNSLGGYDGSSSLNCWTCRASCPTECFADPVNLWNPGSTRPEPRYSSHSTRRHLEMPLGPHLSHAGFNFPTMFPPPVPASLSHCSDDGLSSRGNGPRLRRKGVFGATLGPSPGGQNVAKVGAMPAKRAAKEGVGMPQRPA